LTDQSREGWQHDDRLLLEHPEIFLQVSSPVAAVIEHLIGGISMARIWDFAGGKFQFVRAELVPPPIFQESMKFHALSPITERIRGEREHPTWPEFRVASQRLFRGRRFSLLALRTIGQAFPGAATVRRLIDYIESKCIAMFDGALVPDFGKSQTQPELQVFAKRNPVAGKPFRPANTPQLLSRRPIFVG